MALPAGRVTSILEVLMPVDRPGVAKRVALEYVARMTPEGTSPGRFRPLCDQWVLWVFDGGRDNRPETPLTDFVRQTVAQAVEAGFEHAYGDSHRNEIDPRVIARLSIF